VFHHCFLLIFGLNDCTDTKFQMCSVVMIGILSVSEPRLLPAFVNHRKDQLLE